MKGSLSQLENVLNSTLVNSNVNFDGVSIDSRTIKKGNLFVAIKGENFDGHQFVNDAVKKGSAAIVTEKEFENIPQLIVKDTVVALGKIANFYLDALKPLTIAITGTNGKTTVTKLIGSMLNKFKSTLTNFGNFNNHIGLPLSILKMNDEHQICVLEMGASRKGDIEYLTSIACPKIVALLNVSAAHLESFKDIDNILLTKEEIFSDQGYEKIVILNKDDTNFLRWNNLIKKHQVKTISKTQTADYYIKNIENNVLAIQTADGKSFKLTLKQHHKHQIDNILFSVACASEAGASHENIIDGYYNFNGVNGRFYLNEGINGSTVIDDSYNANPSSMKLSLESLISMTGVAWFVMGDMGELGIQSQKFHSDLALYAKKIGVKKLFYVGQHKELVSKSFGENSFCFKNKSELVKFIQNIITNDVNILIKASRFMEFETIVGALKLRKD